MAFHHVDVPRVTATALTAVAHPDPVVSDRPAQCRGATAGGQPAARERPECHGARNPHRPDRHPRAGRAGRRPGVSSERHCTLAPRATWSKMRRRNLSRPRSARCTPDTRPCHPASHATSSTPSNPPQPLWRGRSFPPRGATPQPPHLPRARRSHGCRARPQQHPDRQRLSPGSEHGHNPHLQGNGQAGPGKPHPTRAARPRRRPRALTSSVGFVRPTLPCSPRADVQHLVQRLALGGAERLAGEVRGGQ